MSDNLEKWVRRLSEQEMPVFKHSVTAIGHVTQSDESSGSELAQVVLQDAGLTARILKLANSAVYNPGGQPVNTISRAVFFLGFSTVRTLSLSLAVIDALLKSNAQKYVLEVMAQSLHGAVQAQSFAEQNGDDSPEEVFIATLLYNLGEMAFWCVAGKEGEQIIALMEEKNVNAEEAQQEVLGFTFKELTVGLTQDWHLGDLLHSALNKPGLKNPRIQNIVLGQELAKNATQGWDHYHTTSTLKKVAKHLDIELEDVEKISYENAHKAIDTARSFGANNTISYIPMPAGEEEEGGLEATGDADYLEPDPMLQLNILRDLSGILDEKPSLSVILEIVSEGIYRGIGMDRCLFAMLTPDRKILRGKHALGDGADTFLKAFAFDMKAQRTLFNIVLQKNMALWVKDAPNSNYAKALPGKVMSVLACDDFFISPVHINQKSIGLFYADRKASGRALDGASYQSFKHFVTQACMAITHISGAR
ncbi:hypothetical protein A9Q89_02245 [Gammaproteobacteria bacterium 53_120_T64]|nr:hypothetical protein A9Q89_02245 [Gammaproteobacteria bacterium 53_120_T64]